MFKLVYYVENNNNTNVFIAAFTIANAKLKLYEMSSHISVFIG